MMGVAAMSEASELIFHRSGDLYQEEMINGWRPGGSKGAASERSRIGT
jgi:hypothetical protein